MVMLKLSNSKDTEQAFTIFCLKNLNNLELLVAQINNKS